MPDGSWFQVPGQTGGQRTLEEQMRGLQFILAEAKGKTVLDLGCAEGLIALEFAKVGAARVVGYDYNKPFIELACRLSEGAKNVEFHYANLAMTMLPKADIVLALAIVHKLAEPEKALAYFASCAARWLIIRLPHKSSGVVHTKHHGHKRCDVNAVMISCGFALQRTERGPRKEWVQYWGR